MIDSVEAFDILADLSRANSDRLASIRKIEQHIVDSPFLAGLEFGRLERWLLDDSDRIRQLCERARK